MHDIICTRPSCTFRVHADYFKDKKRFTAGICPVCNGPAAVVESGTDTVVAGLTFVLERSMSNYGAIVSA
jgi:hypothetical protein